MWTWIKNRFRDTKISNKIALLNSLFFILVLVFILLTFTLTTQRISVDYTAQNAVQRNAIITEKINHILENAEDMSSLIVYNDSIQRKLLESSRMDILTRDYPISNVMNKVVQNSSGINSILLLPAQGQLISTSRVNLNRLDVAGMREMTRRMEKNWNELQWQDMHTADYHILHSKGAAVTLWRNIISIYNGEIVGVLSININESEISSTYLEEVNGGGAAQIFIINGDGLIVSSQSKELLLTSADHLSAPQHGKKALPFSREQMERILQGENGIYQAAGEKYLVTVSEVDRLGWRVVRLNSLASVYSGGQVIMTVSTMVGLIALALAAVASKSVSSAVTRPILALSRIMAQPEEQMLYDVELTVRGNDEIALLTKSFKRMQLRIQMLIERIKFEQQQKAQLSMHFLQNQINPHFLYNTLESVCALIQVGRLEDATKMIKGIEMFYRGTLSKGSNVITLKEEVFVSRQYVLIQRYRYDGNLNVTFRIGEDILDSRIPKLTLQPILENAIYHGLKNGGRDGEIHITEEHDDMAIYLRITDNGDGFVPGQMEREPPAKGKGGYGLYNTQQRIKAYFGEEYGLQVDSAPGAGTVVTICIPNRKSYTETE